MIIEITGSPASGKSYFAQYKLSNKKIYPIKSKLLSILFDFFVLFFFPFFLQLNVMRYITRKSLACDSRVFFKINILRNSLKKVVFFKIINLIGYSKSSIVDEGISHLPYLFRLNKEEDFLEFCDLFSDYLNEIHAIHVLSEPSKTRQRLLSRGHKRIRGMDENYIDNFLNENESIANLMLSYYPTFLRKYELK